MRAFFNSEQLLVGALTAITWFRPRRRASLHSFSTIAEGVPWLVEPAGLNKVTSG